MNTVSTIVIAFLVSFGVSFLLTPIVRTLAIRFGFTDDPKRNHPAILHTVSIPRAGGVAMFIAFSITAMVFAQHDVLLWGILLGGGLNVVLGTLDDKYDISPIMRLLFQIISGVIVVIAGVQFSTSNLFGEGVLYFDWLSINLLNHQILLLADAILIFWILFLMNTINWTKGASQLPGVAVIAFVTLAVVAMQYQAGNPYQIQTAILAAISAGTVLAFLPYNYPPEKMFPGFGASTFIGFNLAVLSVLSGGKVATVLIVLAIPIIDAILVGTKRILSGGNPLIHDREHLYHFLLDSGMTKRQVIAVYWISSALFATTSIVSHTQIKIATIGTLSVLVSIFFYYLYKKRNNQD